MKKSTITREQFLGTGAIRYELVSVPGFGDIVLRSLSEMQKSKRFSQRYDSSGKMIPVQAALQDIYAVIDHVMIDEQTPMFTDADVDLLGEMDASKLEPLYIAINQFNSKDQETEKNELSGSPTISVA